MNFNFQNLIKEIEGTKKYLFESIENLSETTKVMNALDLTDDEAKILSYIFYFQVVKSKSFNNEELLNEVDIRDKRYLKFLKAIEMLQLKRFVNYKFDDEDNFFSDLGFFYANLILSRSSLNFFLTGQVQEDDGDPIFNVYQLYRVIDNIYSSVSESGLSEKEIELFIEKEMNKISKNISDNFPFARIISQLPPFELLLLGLLCEQFVRRDYIYFNFEHLSSSKIDIVLKRRFRRIPILKKTMLYQKNIIRLVKSERVKGTVIMLTERVLKKFFDFTFDDFDSLKFFSIEDKIEKKELFFNNSIERTVKEIEDVLTERKYRKFCSLMAKNKINPVISVLLYGEPGTGKTEFVMQVAKKTKRPLLRVDVSKIVSKWHGESEKNVRGIFEEYNRILKSSKRHPILLLNEADAFLSERISIHDSVDQIHNAMRDIFLEELENMEGIVFATTNLVDEIDEAFFRRFSFKLHFEKPDREVRKRIWKSKKPDLRDDVIERLSVFPLTGGDIDNVLKRFLVSSITSDNLTSDEVLLKLAEEEAQFKNVEDCNPVLGFKVV